MSSNKAESPALSYSMLSKLIKYIKNKYIYFK